MGFIFLFGFLALALFIGMSVRRARLERERQARFLALATSKGWAYTANDPAYVDIFTIAPCRLGSSRRALCVFRGASGGREFASFEHGHVTTRVDSEGRVQREDHVFQVIAVGLPGALPATEFLHEGLGAKVTKFFGDDDLTVESNDFNERWFVRASEQRVAHAILTPRMIERLLARDTDLWSIATDQGWLFVYYPQQTSTAAIEPTVAMLGEIADLVPAFVYEDLGKR